MVIFVVSRMILLTNTKHSLEYRDGAKELYLHCGSVRFAAAKISSFNAHLAIIK